MRLIGNTIYASNAILRDRRFAPDYPPRLGAIVNESLGTMRLRLNHWSEPLRVISVDKTLSEMWDTLSEPEGVRS